MTVDEKPVYDLITTNPHGVAAYYRLLADTALPADIGRILYLDSDINIAGTIDAQWERDLCADTIAAVADANVAPDVKKKLSKEQGRLYFNLVLC